MTARQEREIILRVAAVFRVGLGRDPEPQALAHFTHRLKSLPGGGQDEKGLAQLAEWVVASPEFRARHEGTDVLASEWGPAVFRAATGRFPVAEEYRDLRACISPSAIVAYVAARSELREDIDVFRLRYSLGAPPWDDGAYALWTLQHATLPLCSCVVRPEITVDLCLSVQPGEEAAARATLASLATNSDVGWTLYLVGSFAVLAALEWESVASCGQGRIVPILPDVASLCPGEAPFFGWLEAGDRLADGALSRIVDALAAHPQAVFLFADDDRIDAMGDRGDARLHSGWSMDQLLVGEATDGFCLFSRTRLDELRQEDWLSVASEGDMAAKRLRLALAVTEEIAPERIVHFPGVACHRASDRRGLGTEQEMHLVRRYLASHRPELRLEQARLVGGRAEHPRVIYPLPTRRPHVSIIVPTRDRAEYLRTCLQDVLHETAWEELDVLVLDNGSREDEMLRLLDDVARDPRVRVLTCDEPFNWSRLNNAGVAATRGELVLLLNDDVAIRHPDWLEEMVRQALRPGVGIVGARLLYPDDTIQHAGVALSEDGAAHLLRGAAADDAGYLGQLARQRDLMAVTGACLMVHRDALEQVGGLDEELEVACNDIDLCLRVIAAGRRVVWTPFATLTHVDGGTRGTTQTPETIVRHWRETARLVGRWGAWMRRDAVVSPFLRVTEHSLLLRENE
ncbi:glycosyltransferase [Acetobacter estunensis NRIC 0472]|uniref:Glycosyltransferase n=1 Tax=Acetobacter estunensis TaxID=104097 RepID=A0A967BC78_9PROT|nr:glycosyltransferase family 2 protein [Acetobacter estunensis]NHO54363.1 glycosyltransferase [Acetobacter estunensis]GBQ21834.1 glycosyltransferase [Acetobacter estunensis NRIC 0472]